MEPSRFWSKVQITDGCWNWTAFRNVGRGGYGFYRVSNDKSMVQSHRYAWELTYGPIPEGMLVCHHCDNPSCVRPDHLFLGTILSNAQDRDRKGRLDDRHGENHRQARLSNEDIFYIRDFAEKNKKRGIKAMLGRKFRVSVQHICAIVSHKTWSHI